MATATATLRLDSSRFMAGINQANRSLSMMAATSASVTRAMVGGLIAVVGVASVTGLALKAVNRAAAFEQLAVSMKTLTGSVLATKNIMRDLAKFAAETPYQMDELAQGAKAMMAFGVAQKDVVPTMRMLGDIASGLNINLGELAQVVGRNMVQGRLFQRDIYQLQMRGIPIIAALAKQFGVAESEVLGMATAGQIMGTHMMTALQGMTGKGGQFFNMMKAQSSTWNGLMSTLNDELDMTFVKLGEPVIDALKPALQAAIGFMGTVKAKATEAGEAIGEIFTIMRGAFTNGSATTIISQTGDFLGKTVLNNLAGAFQTATNMFRDAFLPIIQGIGDMILGTLLESFAEPVARFQDQVQAAVEYWSAIMGMSGDDHKDRVMQQNQRVQYANDLVRSAEDQLQGVEDRKPNSGHKSRLGIPDEHDDSENGFNSYKLHKKNAEERLASARANLNTELDAYNALDPNNVEIRTADAVRKEREANGGAPTIYLGSRGNVTAAQLKLSGAKKLRTGYSHAMAAGVQYSAPDLFGAEAAKSELGASLAAAGAAGDAAKKEDEKSQKVRVASDSYKKQMMSIYGARGVDAIDSYERGENYDKKVKEQKKAGKDAPQIPRTMSDAAKAQTIGMYGAVEGKKQIAAYEAGGTGSAAPKGKTELTPMQIMAKMGRTAFGSMLKGTSNKDGSYFGQLATKGYTSGASPYALVGNRVVQGKEAIRAREAMQRAEKDQKNKGATSGDIEGVTGAIAEIGQTLKTW